MPSSPADTSRRTSSGRTTTAAPPRPSWFTSPTLDGDLTDTKRLKLHAILETRFALDAAATDELIEAAAADDREAVDFYHFTSLLMRTLDEAGRLRVIEMMWEMVYVDGGVSEFEYNVMWRVADLLAVSPRDRIALRERVAAARAGADGSS